jgi:hypothetical protein
MERASSSRPDSSSGTKTRRIRTSKDCTFRLSLAVCLFCNLFILLGSSDMTDVLIGNSGHSPEWASPRDQRAWFAGVSGAIIGPDRQGLGSALRDEL